MRKAIVVIALALVLLLPITVLAVSITGLDSLVSLNRTGVGDSWFGMEMSGVSESRFIIGWWALSAPTNLLLTYISDNEVDVSWTKGYGAENTMVRAAGGRLPADRSDGYLVYYGDGTSATDYEADLEQQVVWYRAWSQDAGSSWEDEGIWDSIGGMSIALVVLGMLAAGLTIAMFATRRMLLGFPAGVFWAVLAGFSYQQSTSTWDWQYILFFASIGMTIFAIYAAFTLRKRDLTGPDMDEGAFVDEESPENLDEESSWGDIDRLGMHDLADKEPRSGRRSEQE
jgi:hypothetical protein